MLNPGKWINGRTPIDPLSGKIMENPTFWLNKQSPAWFFFFAIHLHVSINLFIPSTWRTESTKNPEIRRSSPFMTKVMWALPFNLFVFGYFSIFFLKLKIQTHAPNPCNISSGEQPCLFRYQHHSLHWRREGLDIHFAWGLGSAVKHPWDTSGVCLKLGDLAPRMAI